MLGEYDLSTHLGAYLFRHSYVFPNGLIGVMTLHVLDGYIDTSGNERTESDRFMAVSGCLSTPLKWAEFHKNWQAYLQGAGFQPDPKSSERLCVFHTTDFWNGSCEFMPRGLSDDEKTEIYRDLIEIIREHTVYRFGFAASIRAFRQLEADFPHSREFYVRKAGTQLSRICIQNAHHWAFDHGYTPRIAYVFDQGDEFFGEIYSEYHRVRKRLAKEGDRTNVASITEASKRDFSPLQAADIVAWECRQYLLGVRDFTGLASAVHTPVRYELERLSGIGESDFRILHSPHVRKEMLSKIEKTLTSEIEEFVGDGKKFSTVEEFTRVMFASVKETEKAKQAEIKAKRKAR